MKIIGSVDYFTYPRSREKKFLGLEMNGIDSTQILDFWNGFDFGAKTSIPLFFSVFVVGLVAYFIKSYFKL